MSTKPTTNRAMLTRRHALALLAATAAAPRLAFGAPASPMTFSESPFVAKIGGDKPLPPVAERLPKTPRVLNLSRMGREAGMFGGDLRMMIGGQRDIRYIPIFCYNRLVSYNEHFKLEADILESFEVENERIFTFRIREGHKWSDGEPFTSEDFRYVWQDVFHEKKLARGGPPATLLINGKPPKFEVLDELTVRYSWDDPNPDFLADLASPSPTRIWFPAKYLKQFHARYQTEEMLAQFIKKYRVQDWAALHQFMSRTVRPENPNLPTLDAWRNRTAPPAEQFVFERNPYYHRVDEKGQQLPYVDRVILGISSADLIPAKTGTGEADLQVTNLDFADYTFLKSAEKRYAINVDLWKQIQGSRIALIPNLNCKDEGWRKVVQDVRFRRALSLAIDRSEINKAVFYGLAKESANTVLPDSPLFKPEYRDAWAIRDVGAANALLDAAGLPMNEATGFRTLPDGRPLTIVVESAGDNSFQADVLELVTDHLRDIGVKIFTHVTDKELMRRRLKGGDTVMAVWSGLDNGVPTADMSPKELAPTSDDQLQWPVWGLHAMSVGTDGHPPDLPEAIELLKMMHEWRDAGDEIERTEIWHKMLSLFTDQVFTIGIVNSALQPVVRARRLKNVPDKALYGFDPTSYLGVYMPDTFWYEGGA